ncbi:hypothetical protein OROMI_003838 [Orobanche minor]
MRMGGGYRPSDCSSSQRPSDYSSSLHLSDYSPGPRSSDYSWGQRPSDFSKWGLDEDYLHGDSSSTVLQSTPSEDAYAGSGRSGYSLVASKQMVGVFLAVWVRSELKEHVKNIKVSCVGR